MQPNAIIPKKIAHFAYNEKEINDLHEKHLIKQQQFFSEKKEKQNYKKSKKSKKEKNRKVVEEDRIVLTSSVEVPSRPTRNNIPPHHEYQNILEQIQLGENQVEESHFRRFGDTEKPYEKKSRCAIQHGVYVFDNSKSVTSSLTSFAEIEQMKVSQEIDISSSEKLKNFSLSKYLYLDVKSAFPTDNAGKNNSEKPESNSSKSSSLSNKSIDSMEQAIIMNGLKNSENQTNSYLGPFNFLKLLKPTVGATESLRKRIKLSENPVLRT